MIYLIYVTWRNTKDNHSGMKHLCERLEELYPKTFKAIEFSNPDNNRSYSKNKLIKKFQKTYSFLVDKHVNYLKTKIQSRKVLDKITFNSKDVYILMEYMITYVNQYLIAEHIKARNPDGTIYGLSHLVPSSINEMYNDYLLSKWCSKVDYILTLGSSLTKYYINRGLDQTKVITTFHYVDEYYLTNKIYELEYQVLVQGNMKRNFDLLKEIVECNPDIKFLICQGLRDLSHEFGDKKNVKLIPFLLESDLRDLMSTCPVSLNIMDDTIGSNVITTSMGMGMAMICSDVGSIRDYCDSSNCIFCKTKGEFSSALQNLKNDKEKLMEMRQSSAFKAKNLSLLNFGKELISIVNQSCIG